MFNFFLMFFTVTFLLLSPVNSAFAAGEAPTVKSPVYFGLPEYEGISNEVYGEVDGGIFRLRSGDEFGVTDFFENANSTGYGVEQADNYNSVIKSAYTGNVIQKTHGEYQNNTNSCASCHQTHTSSGGKLLFRKTIWDVCTACHDGTLGMLNVLADPGSLQSELLDGTNENRLYSLGGGTFAGPAGMGSSMHMATGMLKVNVAPGGNKDGEGSDAPESWGAVFSCASCHSPHGSYSSRLLHYNPNNVGARTNEERGYKTINVDVYSEVYDSQKRYFVPDNTSPSTSFLNRDKTPWLNDYDYQDAEEGSVRDYWTKVFVNGNEFIDAEETRSWMQVLSINSAEAYFTDPQGLIPIGAEIRMDISPATVVTFEFTGDKVTNYGDSLSMSKFCTSCHNDYLNLKSGPTPEKYTEIYGHKVDLEIPDSMEVVGGRGLIDGAPSKMLNCLTCHYGHGTSRDIMLNADNEVSANPIVADQASTALKRYINMSVCTKCHGDLMLNQPTH